MAGALAAGLLLGGCGVEVRDTSPMQQPNGSSFQPGSGSNSTPPSVQDNVTGFNGATVQPNSRLTTGTGECVTGEQMADRQGWQIYDRPESVTRFGGVRVLLVAVATLPAGWEAWTNQGVNILAWHTDRRLPSGVNSIYPPPGECRDRLGVSR